MIVVHILLLALSFFVFWLASFTCGPFLVAVHEIGHALPALALTSREVRVELGMGEIAWHKRLGWLIVTLSLEPRRRGLWGSRVFVGWRRFKPYGRVRHERTPSALRMVPMPLGGPLASLALAWGMWRSASSAGTGSCRSP